MEREAMLQKKHKLLDCLSNLPRKILLLHGQENIIEFVLHELCQEYCFDLEKAAYFVSNPDFNCLKGVAGFCRRESYVDDDIWQNPKKFSAHMQKAPFNKRVRLLTQPSNHKDGELKENSIIEIARDLTLKNPSFHRCDTKHNNRGYLVYEKENQDKDVKEYLTNGISLLNFCPLY